MVFDLVYGPKGPFLLPETLSNSLHPRFAYLSAALFSSPELKEELHQVRIDTAKFFIRQPGVVAVHNIAIGQPDPPTPAGRPGCRPIHRSSHYPFALHTIYRQNLRQNPIFWRLTGAFVNGP